MKTVTSAHFYIFLVVTRQAVIRFSRRIRAMFVLATALTFTGAVATAAQQQRTVTGVVYYAGGEPAKGAAVQLKNTANLQIVSQISDAAGLFHFDGLSADVDYEVKAMKNGHWSKSHRISHFSSKNVEEVKLSLSGDVGEK